MNIFDRPFHLQHHSLCIARVGKKQKNKVFSADCCMKKTTDLLLNYLAVSKNLLLSLSLSL